MFKPQPIGPLTREQLAMLESVRARVAESNGHYNVDGHTVGEQFIAPSSRAHNYEWQSEAARLVAQELQNDNGKEPDLDDIDVCAITPLDALNLLFLLQKKRSKVR